MTSRWRSLRFKSGFSVSQSSSTTPLISLRSVFGIDLGDAIHVESIDQSHVNVALERFVLRLGRVDFLGGSFFRGGGGGGGGGGGLAAGCGSRVFGAAPAAAAVRGGSARVTLRLSGLRLTSRTKGCRANPLQHRWISSL